jgi:hypothetical protein
VEIAMVAEIGRASQMGNEQLEIIAWREIGQRLQMARSQLDEPFAVVAGRAEIKPTDLAAIERGEMRPKGKEIKSLIAALKISQMDFVGDLSLAARKLFMELLEPEPEAPSAKPEDYASVMNHNAESLSPIDGGRVEDVSIAGVKPSPPFSAWGVARKTGQITYYEMHACLRGLFKRTDRGKAEIIYSWTSPAEIDVKVFTSIDARTGLARPTGEDAIRIVVYDKRARRKIVSWSVELKRVGNWQARMREKTGAAVIRASFRPRCPGCKQDTMIIFGRNEAQFWGCSNYPKCRGTFNLEFGEPPVS